MAQPLHVSLSNGLPRYDLDTIRHLIEIVATLCDAPLEHTAIHVKQGGVVGRQISGMAYYNRDGKPFSQQAHRSRINTHPDACELVTLRMGKDYAYRYANGTYQVMHYARYTTFPHTKVYTWHEEFVYLLAHELCHIAQYHRPRRTNGRASASEYECEQAAIRCL